MQAAEDSKYTIAMSQTGEFTRQKGQEVMESFLKSGGRDTIDILFSQNDDMALGAIQAIEAAGLQPGKDIVIVSVDGVGAFQARLTVNPTAQLNAILFRDHFSWKLLRKFLNLTWFTWYRHYESEIALKKHYQKENINIL